MNVFMSFTDQEVGFCFLKMMSMNTQFGYQMALF